MRLIFRTLTETQGEPLALLWSEVLPHAGDYVSLPDDERPAYRVKSVVIDYKVHEPSGGVSAVVYVQSEVG